MSTLFGCIGNHTPASIDFVDDDTISFDFFMAKEWLKVWSNRITMRAASTILMMISLLLIANSTKVDSYIEQVPTWEEIKAKHDGNAINILAVGFTLTAALVITTIPWLRQRPMRSLFMLFAALICVYCFVYKSF